MSDAHPSLFPFLDRLWIKVYDPCIWCWRPARRGGYLSCRRCFRDAQTHGLKCVPPFFQAVLDGVKPFDVRKHDRPFAEGDILHLREFWNGAYTGRECRRTVTYVLVGGEFGVERGYVVMGIAE